MFVMMCSSEDGLADAAQASRDASPGFGHAAAALLMQVASLLLRRSMEVAGLVMNLQGFG